MNVRTSRIAVVVVGILASSYLLAQQMPLTNWTVPAYRASSASGGLTAMTDVTPGVGFVGVAPCRLVDTRQAGFPAGYGPPSLSQGQPRNFDLNSDPQCPGIPAGVDAYSLNITVTNTQGPGFILIYPQGGSQPTVSTVNYVAGQTIANAAIVPAGTNGGVTVIAGVSGTDLVIDINGYFTDQYNPGVSFHAVSTTVAPAILAENTSTVANAIALQAVITSTTPGAFATAISGVNNGNGYGISGTSASGYGVVASTGGSASNAAVYASNSSTANFSSAVYGQETATGPGIFYGIFGTTSQDLDGSSGVLGVGRGGRVTPGVGWPTVTGVRGEAYSGTGVLGLSVQTGEVGFDHAGVRGMVTDTLGNKLADGFLGYANGSTHLGLASGGDALVNGNLTVTGNFSSANKFFVQPHPYDEGKEIRYVSLEGPHAGVYFRGTAQIAQGVTRVEVPQDFRFVTDPQTYSTLVTPVGGMATVTVLSEGPDGVVVQASRDVKVHYVVYAERSAIKNPNPITENVDFRPIGDLKIFESMPDSYKRLLVQNGTLNLDGTLNRETARRLGWEMPDKADEPISRTSSK